MRLIMQTKAAGRVMEKMNPEETTINTSCQINFWGRFKSTPVVGVRDGYKEIILDTENGAEYVVAIEDESELDSKFIKYLITACNNSDVFAPLKDSAFMRVLVANHKP